MDIFYGFFTLLPFEWAQFGFMQQALVAAIILCPLLAFLGCMVVNNQMSFFSDAIGHSALTGIAIGTIIGMSNPLWSMIIFSIVMAICITLLRKYGAVSSDTVIGIVMSTAVSLGIVILSRGGNFNRYSRYLIGDFLSISKEDIYSLFLVALLFLLIWIVVFNKIYLVSVNASLAGSRKINVLKLQTIFSIITALVITISIQWIGILVINALIILPAAASRSIARSTCSYIWIASGISIISGVTGIISSFYWSTASGATIVLFSSMFYFISIIIRMFNKG